MALARHNILQSTVLTPEEIENFNVDYFRLKLIKMGIMNYINGSLVIAIKTQIDFKVNHSLTKRWISRS